MFKSLCIKTNNNKILNYLLKEVENLELDSIYISKNKFKIYSNVVIHYTGDCLDVFLDTFADILTNTIITFYEKKLLSRILNNNYFYFLDSEKKEILRLCLESLTDINDDSLLIEEKIYIIKNSVLEYITHNKSIVLDGFINFRLQEYLNVLDYISDLSVNRFLIEREYIEFIKLLRLYIDSREPEVNLVHLIYQNATPILLDEQKNIIYLDDNMFKAKYLSDISFSSNDYTLNTLLTLLPKKISIHLIDEEDEFINTLILIFGDTIKICNDCDICKTYTLVGINDTCSNIPL